MRFTGVRGADAGSDGADQAGHTAGDSGLRGRQRERDAAPADDAGPVPRSSGRVRAGRHRASADTVTKGERDRGLAAR